MALNKVEICGVNTSKLTVLTNEEKEKLFERIREGDEEARQQYIKGNLRLVLSVIKRFSASSENVDDLFQIGCIRADQGDRQLRSDTQRKVQHLCRSHDYR